MKQEGVDMEDEYRKYTQCQSEGQITDWFAKMILNILNELRTLNERTSIVSQKIDDILSDEGS